jgi:hypothetical protein
VSVVVAPSLAEALWDEIECIKSKIPNSRWFLFGSALNSKQNVGDIDLLIVTATFQDGAKVRAGLASFCELLPLHLMFMTAAEESEVMFINGEGAVELGDGKIAKGLLTFIGS